VTAITSPHRSHDLANGGGSSWLCSNLQSFKFKDYGPKVFHHLRQRFAIDQHHYLNSLGGAYEYIEFNSE